MGLQLNLINVDDKTIFCSMPEFICFINNITNQSSNITFNNTTTFSHEWWHMDFEISLLLLGMYVL